MKSIFLLPLLLNSLCWVQKTDYLQSVFLVFGMMSVVLLSISKINFKLKDLKIFLGFILFSNLATIGLEILMMKFDVWGFTNRVYSLSGINIFGAPIEEYIYWFFCPVIVSLSYVLFNKNSNMESWTLRPTLMNYFSKIKLNGKDKTNYVNAEDGTYTSGKKYPVYIYVQLMIILTIVVLMTKYKGSWKPIFKTTLLFFLVAFPNEFYSIHQGYWAYNDNRMLGMYILSIPVEGWMMYFIAPVCASLMLNLIYQKAK